jgi:hypothetical protein
MTTLTLTRDRAEGMTADERRVIFASSLGTVFEWYGQGVTEAATARHFSTSNAHFSLLHRHFCPTLPASG